MTNDAKRYQRHLVMPEVGPTGQARLAQAAVLVIGVGGLGGYHAELLVRAGIGRVRLADRDRVDWSNLPRQIQFDERDAAAQALKAERAAERLRAINHAVTIEAHAVAVGPDNIEALLNGIDLVLDATDNFETRHLINDACVKLGKPWVYGGIIGTSGMVMLVQPGDGPCLRCLMPEPPTPDAVPTAETAGVLNSAVAVVAAWQVTAALRTLIGPAPEEYQLVSLDPWHNTCRPLKVKRAPHCPCCVEHRFDYLERR